MSCPTKYEQYWYIINTMFITSSSRKHQPYGAFEHQLICVANGLLCQLEQFRQVRLQGLADNTIMLEKETDNDNKM